VSCYLQTRGSLSSCFKRCLDNTFVAEESFRVFMFGNYST
jgi:hypothetical protein